MKAATALAIALSLGAGESFAQSLTGSLSRDDVQAVAPALNTFADEALARRLWARHGLSPRDRSIATLAVVVARSHLTLLADQIRLALDNDVKPAEISEIITHLAFYAGWGPAMTATGAARTVFAERNIGVDQLPAAAPQLLQLDEASEARRAASVEQSVGSTAPGLVSDTTDVLFKNLWLRPDMAPRDRSLVTVSALIANGQTEQITPHLNRALDNGLTEEEAGEMISHLAYYAGWPNSFSAASTAREVFAKRSK